MSDTEHQELGALAKVVIAIAVILVVSGILLYGLNFATIERVFRQLVARAGAPLSFRFILQPAMAAFAAIHDARRDARLGRPPFLWTMLHRPGARIRRLREAANATARIMLLGMVIDAIYQMLELHRFYPAEAVVIALVLAFLPYVVLRGLVLRVLRRWLRNDSTHQV